MKSYLKKETLKEIKTLTGREVPDPNSQDYDDLLDQLKASDNPDHHRAAMLMESKVKMDGQDPRERLEQRAKRAEAMRKLRRRLFLNHDGMEGADAYVFSRGKAFGWTMLIALGVLGWLFTTSSSPSALAEGSATDVAGITGGATGGSEAARAGGSGGATDKANGETVVEAVSTEAASTQTTQRSSVEPTGDPFAGFGGAPLSSTLAGTPTLPVGAAGSPYGGDPAQAGAAGNPYDPVAAGSVPEAQPRIVMGSLNVTPGRRAAQVHADGGAAARSPLAAFVSPAAPRRAGGGLYVSPAAPRRTAVLSSSDPRSSNARRGGRHVEPRAPEPRGTAPDLFAAPQSGGAMMPSAPTGYMNVFQSVQGEPGALWGETGGSSPTFVDPVGNPYDPATVTPESAPVSAPAYAVGDSVKATLEVGPVIVEGEGTGQSNAGSNQVVARDENGTAWVGEAVLQRSGRMTVRFTAAIDGNGERRVEAIALDLDSFAGLPATFQETSPALASNLARGALRGVTNYVDDLRGSASVRQSGFNTVVTDNVAPLDVSILGSVAELFTPPSSDQQALVRIATIEPDTEFILKVLQ